MTIVNKLRKMTKNSIVCYYQYASWSRKTGFRVFGQSWSLRSSDEVR